MATHELGDVCPGHVLVEAAEVPEEGVEVAAVEVLHDEVQVLPAGEGVEEADDEGVARGDEDVALRQDALHGVLPDHVRLPEHLDGEEVARDPLPSEEDAPEGAAADGLDDLEVLDRRPVLEPGGIPGGVEHLARPRAHAALHGPVLVDRVQQLLVAAGVHVVDLPAQLHELLLQELGDPPAEGLDDEGVDLARVDDGVEVLEVGAEVLERVVLGALDALDAAGDGEQALDLLEVLQLRERPVLGELRAGFTISLEISRYTRYFGFIGGVQYFFYRPKLIF